VHSFNVGSVMEDPRGIAYHPGNGKLYVTDRVLRRVYAWTPFGLLTGSFSIGGMTSPTAICYMSTDGTFLITDLTYDVYEYTVGGLLRAVDDLSDLNLYAPSGLSFDPVTGTVFVVSSWFQTVPSTRRGGWGRRSIDEDVPPTE